MRCQPGCMNIRLGRKKDVDGMEGAGPKFYACRQCGGSGSVISVWFPWVRIHIKIWLDPESGSLSGIPDPDPTKTIKN